MYSVFFHVIGPKEELFSVEINHGGVFLGFGANKKYMDCKTDFFDHCEVETWSPLWIKDFVQQLGYDPSKVQCFWLLPGMNLDNGLRIIDRDADCLSMTVVVPKFKHFKLYMDHGDIYSELNMDDICIIGSPTMPNIMSPMKPQERGTKSYIRSSPRIKSKAQKGRTKEQVQKNNDSDSDDSDSDCSYEDWADSDNDFKNGDDNLFEEWVDDFNKDLRAKKNKAVQYERDSDYDTDELELPASENEGNESEHEVVMEKWKKKKKKKVKLRSFKPEDMKAPIFKLGMKFPTAADLRRAIREYAIQNRVAIKYAKNDKQRIRAHCSDDCPWYLFAAPDSRTTSFVVKTYVGDHTCSKEWEVNGFTSRYLAGKYLENFRADEKMTLMNFARLVQKDYNMIPTRSKLARARRIAIKQIHGDEEKQYSMMWDYAQEIRMSNPGSSMFIKLKDGRFHQCYMSLDACKRGFLAGCRPVICVDGCHLKTKYGGQLLTAVGIDPNNCIFPIAMAVVEVEDTPTWKWFLQTLKDDLHIVNTAPWTVMSDRQKGLINAVTALFPHGQHRFCVRHLYQNFAKKWKGENLKNKLWAIARSYNKIDWRKNMDDMKELNLEAYEYLEAIEPSSWCRAFFQELPKCDLLLNNNCEVFNK